MRDPVSQIAQIIHSSQRIVITSHLRPDGDSICTGLALCEMGELLGKEMSFINRDPSPFPFNKMEDALKIQIGQIPPEAYDIVILLECANVSRSGQEHIQDTFKINIDHHYSNDDYADINWVDPEAPAVACMAYDLGEKLEVCFTPQIADHLYCAIVSDTGSFQFSNTNAESFEVSHKLVKHGARPIKISEFLYNNNPPQKIKLLGHALATLEMNRDGNIAVITMFKKHLEELNLKEIDTEDITTLARSIRGVQMVLFFKEIAKNTFRVSLRSKGSAHAARVAEHFGGGGHVHAAGFTVKGSHKKLVKDIPSKVNDLLKKKGPEQAKVR